MRNLLFVIALVSSSLFTPQAISACSCEFLPPLQNLGGSAFVFSGTVIEIVEEGATEAESPIFFTTFEVDRSWKGIDGQETTIVSWADSGADCGYSFEVGEAYLVYGYISGSILGDKIETDRSPDVAGGFRLTNGCKQTKRLSEAAGDIAALDGLITIVQPTLWGQIKALYCDEATEER